jgi:hypothetical protein
MAEVKFNGLYKVTLIERERGYGQREIWVRYFETEAEAKQVTEQYTDYRDPDDYYVAEVHKVR